MSNHDISEHILKDGQRLVIRRARLGDEQGLIDQMKAVDSETKFLSREPGEFNLTLDQERKFIEKSLSNDNMYFMVGQVGGEIAGNCSVGIPNTGKRYRHRATMGIAIKKDYWHKGIGKRMMEECIEWCKEKGVEQLELEVVTENTRAISMYEHFGFQVQGTSKRSLKYSDGSYADQYCMILFLNEDR